MSIDREAIYVALFALILSKLGSTFVTISRRHIMPPDLSPAQQPALFICMDKESSAPQPRGTGGKLSLSVSLFIYCYQPATNEAPGTETFLASSQLNGLLKAIDDALATPSNIQTLGGLVSHCWTAGDTLIDQGILGQQAVAIVPLNILVP
jgi:hypothetical protein